MKRTALPFTLFLAVVMLTGCFPSTDDEGIVDKMINKAIDEAEKESEADKKHYSLDEDNSISSTDLINAYDGNAIRADKEFKDKEFEVIGEIGEIGTDMLTELPVIDLRGSGLLDFMQCHFEDSEGLDLLNVDDKVVISGKCIGKDLYVEMTECTIVKKL